MIKTYFKRFNKFKWYKKLALALLYLFIILFIIPQSFTIPVKGATKNDYNPNSFWFYPWGKSGTHKGVDIFAKTGTPVVASTRCFTISTGNAAGKPPHLHYSIISFIPHFWKLDNTPQGWKKMFFLNPIKFIEE